MTGPQPGQPSSVGVLGHTLQEGCARIISECTAAFASERRGQGNASVFETIEKNLPLLLDELIALLPHVMTGEAKLPSALPAGMECRAEHRLDVVIKALSGVSEIVVLELSRLKGCVADEFLTEACREVRLFFDLKVASYCQQFVAAQEAEIALRTRQLREASESLIAAPENSKAAFHSRVHLLQGVTHELRNSLQSVLLYATSLEDGPRDAGATEIMERLASNGLHLQKLLDRLQSCSTLLAGAWHPKPAPVDVGRFLAELEQRHRALARTERTRLTCQQIDGPKTITTDVETLNLIADHLVSNAMHSAKAGSVQVEVSAEGPERMLLKVTDNGNGISLVEARQIFRVMHHVSGFECAGLKLGLLTSRYLTHLLGGEITFESEVGQGASFKVSLPVITEPCQG
jgi:signal transduction histidine kinase